MGSVTGGGTAKNQTSEGPGAEIEIRWTVKGEMCFLSAQTT